MPRVNARSAVCFLARGALGIGEDHTKGEARQLVLDLMNKGYVKHLFLELADTKTDEIHVGGKVTTPVYAIMINAARRVRDDPREPFDVVEKMQKELAIPEKHFFAPGPRGERTELRNPTPITKVIAQALIKKIK